MFSNFHLHFVFCASECRHKILRNCAGIAGNPREWPEVSETVCKISRKSQEHLIIFAIFHYFLLKLDGHVGNTGTGKLRTSISVLEIPVRKIPVDPS